MRQLSDISIPQLFMNRKVHLRENAIGGPRAQNPVHGMSCQKVGGWGEGTPALVLASGVPRPKT